MGQAMCGECGLEDCEPEYIECCSTYMCDRCADRHDERHGRKPEDRDA